MPEKLQNKQPKKTPMEKMTGSSSKNCREIIEWLLEVIVADLIERIVEEMPWEIVRVVLREINVGIS